MTFTIEADDSAVRRKPASKLKLDGAGCREETSAAQLCA